MDKKIKELIITGILSVVFIMVIMNNLKTTSKKRKPPIAPPKSTTSSLSSNKATPVFTETPLDEKILNLQKERLNLSWGRDPFSLEKGSEFVQSELHLKGISFGADKRGYAFINNEIVKAGDRVGDYEVVSVEKDKVTLQHRDGQIFYLGLPKD
ncbi:MAG: hypothetical protein NC912_01455 [Candidatus Omnitrophica bacterium]|nr:hypothetical protein [Candidatus Omnitrophota bacterium]